MVAVTGYSTRPQYFRPSGPQFSTELDEMVIRNNIAPFPIKDSWSIVKSVVVDTQPVSEPALPVTGFHAAGFLADYYYRIHLIPQRIELGNLLSSQTREVEVWNAYLDPQLLSSIDQNGTDGITMAQPDPPPTYFAALETRLYTLNISTNGSPVIDATYQFNFPDESPILEVTGRRVVVWPWMPQIIHDEGMEWKTDIIPSFNNEQRLALRAAPRQEFSYTFQLDPSQFSKAKAISTQWAHRVYGIPVWSELSYVGGLSIGATQILVDTTVCDYRNFDIIVVWQSDTEFLALETNEILADRINLKLPLEKSFSAAYVAPMRFARTYNGASYRRAAGDLVQASLTFGVTSNKDLGASVGYPQYRSKDVLLNPLLALSDVTDKISRTVDVFDNGSGPILVDVTNAYTRYTQSIVIDTLDRQDRWTARKWIHSRRGRQKSFWVPSWNQDLVVLDDIGVSAGSIKVKPIGYPLYYSVKDIMITTNSGSRYYARILSSSVDIDGNEILNLAAPIGTAIPAASIALTCFIALVRFDADSIRAKHGYSGRFTCTIPVVEVPE